MNGRRRSTLRVAVGLAAGLALSAPGCGSGLRDPGAGYVAPDLGELAAGQVLWGAGQYVEYRVGALPLILSSPHGGSLAPSEIRDRRRGYPIGDSRTQELTRLTAEALRERTGREPHVVISRLDRRKLDPNREIGEAADGDARAENAWLEYHGFIDAAKAHVEAEHGAGFYVDVHGHGHRTPWVELGYSLRIQDLNRSGGRLDRWPFRRLTSLRALVVSSPLSHSELVRGASSLGALLVERGYRAVPSPTEPGPGRADFFSGGYSVFRHGSFHKGTISGVQLETPKRGVRDSPDNLLAFAGHLADVLVEFLEAHYGIAVPPAFN